MKVKAKVDVPAVFHGTERIPVTLGENGPVIGSGHFNADGNVFTAEISDPGMMHLLRPKLSHMSIDAVYEEPYFGETQGDK